MQLELPRSDAVSSLREAIANHWSLDSRGLRLLSGAQVLFDEEKLSDCSDGSSLDVQVVKFDPLLDLGKFMLSDHRGIQIQDTSIGPLSMLVKTTDSPDSNNVFIQHPIREPCFVEFEIVESHDEMSLGVTYEAESVEMVSGFGNLRLESTWIFSKKRSMPSLLLGGKRSNIEGSEGYCGDFRPGDRIAVFADPEQREVKFYRNKQLLASNLPSSPLPEANERPLRMYVMVDRPPDTIQIVRFGPGMPY